MAPLVSAPQFGQTPAAASRLYLGAAVRAEFSPLGLGTAFWAALNHRLDHSSPTIRAELGPDWCQSTVLRATCHLSGGLLGIFGGLLGFLQHIAQSKGAGKAFYSGTRLSTARNSAISCWRGLSSWQKPDCASKSANVQPAAGSFACRILMHSRVFARKTARASKKLPSCARCSVGCRYKRLCQRLWIGRCADKKPSWPPKMPSKLRLKWHVAHKTVLWHQSGPSSARIVGLLWSSGG